MALKKELQPGGDSVVVWSILGALCEIGPPARLAIPELANLLTHTNRHAALLSLIALGRIETDQPQWTDSLITKLGQIEDANAMWVAWELGKRGDRALGAVSALLDKVKSAKADGRWETEAMAAAAAWRLDPSAPNPIHSITNNLLVRQGGRYELVRLLGELGPAARPAIPTLKQLRYSHGIMMHEYANDALSKIDPEYLTNPWKQ
jgi:hypothetical protein